MFLPNIHIFGCGIEQPLLLANYGNSKVKDYNLLVEQSMSFLGNQSTTCLPFFVENNKIGYLRDDVIKEIKKFPDIFLFTKNNECKEKVVLNSSLQTFEERSQKIAEILELWRDNSIFVTLNGWRNEVGFMMLCQDLFTNIIISLLEIRHYV